MESMYLKHWMLPIPDFMCRYEIDTDNKRMHVCIDGQLDSALLIQFFQILERERGIEIIDRKSQTQFGPHINRLRYSVCVTFAGVDFDVRCVQMFQQKENDKPEFTFSMTAIQ